MCEVSEKIYREGQEVGEQIGMQKGEQAGRVKEQQATVRRMHQKGYPLEMIADALGISEQKVQEWTA